MRARSRQSGLVVSAELMLVSLILVVGLVTGWVKLRDQSLAEVADSIAAIDTYIAGSAPLWQTGGTRWIKDGGIVEPTVPGASELWDDDDNPMTPGVPWETVQETSPGSGVFEKKDGILLYGAPAAEGPP